MLKQLIKPICLLLIVGFFLTSCKFPYQPVLPPAPVDNEAIVLDDNNTDELINPEDTSNVNKKEDSDYYSENYIRYSDYIYQKNIHSIIFEKASVELSQAIIPLNGEEQLLLRFDDISGKYKELKYTIVLCDATWNPVDLEPIEYIEGYYENTITNYTYSLNTLQNYVHYELLFPNQQIKPKLSGNYILLVYQNDGTKAGDLVLSRRFMVYDQKLQVDADLRPATLLDERKYKQKIDFSINTASFPIYDPYNDLKVVLRQNNRWDNAIWNLKPKMIKGEILDYNYDRENVFSGINEFRELDMKSLVYQSMYIQRIDSDKRNYYVHLKEDERRSFKTYATKKDINGKKYIKNEEAKYDSHIESEYAYVHFYLNYPQILAHGDVYVFGALSDWRFKEENKMQYNFEKKRYEARIYLKQGYYNYLYAFVENNSDVADIAFIEGQHFQTENDYSILVYYRQAGTYYDQLIGIKFLNSLEYK